VLCPGAWYFLVVIVCVFAGAMIKTNNLLLVLACMLAGLLVFNRALVALTLSGLDAERKLPHGVCVGDMLVVTIDVTNKRRKTGSFAVVVEEEIRREDHARREGPMSAAVYFPYVAAGQWRSEAYRGRLARRGRYRLGPLKVSTRFPFGLVRRTLTFGRTDTLYVFPRLGRLTRRWIAERHQDFEGSQRRERRHSRVPGNLFGVREWQDGDSPRWVHWRQSARHGMLVVRQFEERRNPDVAVLVDLWQPEMPNASDLDRVELAVSFAATVVADVCRKGGGNLFLAVTDDRWQPVWGPVSVALLQESMEQLAVAAASSQNRLQPLLERAARAIEPGTDVVLISTRDLDPKQRQEFSAPWPASPGPRIARSIRFFNVASDSLSEYFSAE
jgi:uncharacterized protein (DUF58 family)